MPYHLRGEDGHPRPRHALPADADHPQPEQHQPRDNDGQGDNNRADDPVEDTVLVVAAVVLARLLSPRSRHRRGGLGRRRRAVVLGSDGGVALLCEDVTVWRRGPTVVLHVPGPQAGAARHGRVRDSMPAVVGRLHGGDEHEEHCDKGDEDEERLVRSARR